VDAYCERVGMGVLAEPLNAFSNSPSCWPRGRPGCWPAALRPLGGGAGADRAGGLRRSGSILWHTSRIC
jgi:hypothetical protein